MLHLPVQPRELQYRRNADILRKYIPEAAVPAIADWIIRYDFKLKIKKERNSRLGDYTPPRAGLNHLITVNHNLNKYAFLITLVHEVAHLVTYNEHRNRVLPHGEEWKHNFRQLMQEFLNPEIFPLEVFSALKRYLHNPAASSCSDDHLLRTLKLYDAPGSLVFLEYLPLHSIFLYNGSRLFRKVQLIRKRFQCVELQSGQQYLFNPLTEVEHLPEGLKAMTGTENSF